ncbi:Na+/H+ antiporter subunit C [Pelomicrobium methylotrophicum]|uniref:Na+/H+ antiporter subunit C n=1 Tax=Pelomicrobium methylotrophicum TaxID=2602750 RepID=A0A5C7EKG2_9PROT|nr:Na+/H+ antiporter subunit C [Pelomicrobium methylotrophicum]
MEALVAMGIGALTAGGVFLLLRARTFPVILGLTLISYAVNLFIFAMGRLKLAAPPRIVEGVAEYADPLPQALVLTAIVISFGMTAFLAVLAVWSRLASGTDHVDGAPADGGAVPVPEGGRCDPGAGDSAPHPAGDAHLRGRIPSGAPAPRSGAPAREDDR